jgi:hypothetical protein
MATSTSKIVFDDFVKQVRPDPKEQDQLQLLAGYLGESPVEGHIRIYADASLNHFADIPKNAVVHVHPNTKEEDALGGSRIWVKQNQLPTSTAGQGSFLQGQLYDQYAKQLYQPAANQPAPGSVTLNGICRFPSIPAICSTLTSTFICDKPSVTLTCRASATTPCLTGPALCSESLPYNCNVGSAYVACPTTTIYTITATTPQRTITIDRTTIPFPEQYYGGGFNPYNY